MPIGPVTNSHREISVTEPLSPALERVKTMLFKPFDLGKWFTIGFCAWLAQLGENGGGGGGFNNLFGRNFGADHGGPARESFSRFCHEGRDYLLDNLAWIVPAAAAATILLVALGLVILWLSCRGRFMLLHCVALDKAEVAEPWSKFEREANSLFWFRLVVSLCWLVMMLPLLVLLGVTVVRMFLRGESDPAGIVIAAGLGLALFGLGLVFALIHKFTTDFVVPLQFLRRDNCLAAWREFGGMLADRAGLFTLYILFQIVLSMAIGIIILGAVLITCCIAGCLMLIPYLGTVLLLPVLIFKRAYPLYFLQQFGPGYDVFQSAPSSPPMTGLPPQRTL